MIFLSEAVRGIRQAGKLLKYVCKADTKQLLIAAIFCKIDMFGIPK